MANVTLSKVSTSDRTENGLTVNALDLEIPDGQFVALVGPAGSGISSVIRMIAGLDNIASGEINIGEKQVNELAPKDRDVAMVFANDSLFPNMTVRENIAFGLKRRRFGQAELRKRTEEAASIFMIGDLLEQKPHGLSLIRKQRVAIARAVVRQPKVFLFDHALAFLDLKSGGELAQEIVKLHERVQATTIFATADGREAMSVAERVALFDKGMLRAVDTPRAFYEQPNDMFAAKFFGDPTMNFIEGELKMNRGVMQFLEANSGTIEIDLSKHERSNNADAFVGKIVVLGVRPEDIDLLIPTHSKGQTPVATFRAISEAIAPFGAHTEIHFNTGAHTAIAHSSTFIDRSDAGRRMEFMVNLNKICLFDPVSGNRIASLKRGT